MELGIDIKEPKTMYTPLPRKRSVMMNEETFNISLQDTVVFIVGICGGQGGCKTKLANLLAKKIPNSVVIVEKSFFKTSTVRRKLSAGDETLVGEFDGYNKERKLLLTELSNYNAYDYENFYDTLKKLKEGTKVKVRQFDEESQKFVDELEVDPAKVNVVIVVGYFLFKNEKVRNAINLKIYNEIDDDVRLSRLLINENYYLKNNPIAFKTFFMIYEKYLKSTYETHIALSKQYAQMILPNYIVSENEKIEGDETLNLLLTNLINISKKIKKNKII